MKHPFFVDETLQIYFVKKRRFITFTYGQTPVHNEHFVFLDGLNVFQINNIGTMNPRKPFVGQSVFQFYQTHQRQDIFSICSVNFDVIFQAFDKQNIGIIDFDILVFCPDKHKIVGFVYCNNGRS